jgi:thiosulfate/3-mercaptopyruvate sulfurtransferase
VRTAAALLLLLLLASPAPAAEARGARIVDAASLAAALAAPAAPLVLDARDRRTFEAGHVPGSRPVDWRDFSEVRPGGLTFVFGGSARWGLLSASLPGLGAKLRRLGVAASRPAVVVGSPEGWGEEGRIAWMLLYLGVEDVALLDGGFPAWAHLSGAAVSHRPARAGESGDFTPRPTAARRISREALRRALAGGEVVLLDARTLEEFAGKTLKGQKRGGHLPGARLVPAAKLRSPDGAYASAEELLRLAGPIPREAALVTYCTGGVRSALLAFLLEARLGLVAANYDGSLWEWGDDESLPLVSGTSEAAHPPP